MTKKCDNFNNLHVHSSIGSMADSMAKVDDLFKKAVELGQSAIAITDHGMMAGVFDARKASKKYGVKYLLFTGIASLQRRKTHWIYWSVVFDLTTGRYSVIKEDYYKRKDTKTQLNAHLFDALFQIKSKPKAGY